MFKESVSDRIPRAAPLPVKPETHKPSAKTPNVVYPLPQASEASPVLGRRNCREESVERGNRSCSFGRLQPSQSPVRSFIARSVTSR